MGAPTCHIVKRKIRGHPQGALLAAECQGICRKQSHHDTGRNRDARLLQNDEQRQLQCLRNGVGGVSHTETRGLLGA